METTDNIDELANRIYNNHKAAIDLIIKAQSARDAIDWEIIESTAKQYAPNDFQSDSRSKTILRYYSASLDEIDELRGAQGWTESRRLLLFELKYEGPLNLYLWIGPGSEEAQQTRQHLKSLADDKRIPVGSRSSRSNRLGRWHSIYRKHVLSQEDFRAFDPDEARPKIEQALREFYEKDYWPIVNTIREEFGLPAVSPN